MRTGFFGGTFDPPHAGHKKYAEEFIGRLSLDRLIVIPTFIPPHKSGAQAASGADRLRMLELMFAGGERVAVSDMELKRGGKSYTCETVRQLAELYPEDELIFLVGSDMLLSFHTWREPETILKYVRICAVARDDEIETAELEAYVNEYFPGKRDSFIICAFDPIEISSTQLRERLKKGENTGDMLDPPVLEYIKERKLYL